MNGTTAEVPAIPTVPSNVSAFTNDAGYLTSHQDISGKADKSDTYTKAETDAAIKVETDRAKEVEDANTDAIVALQAIVANIPIYDRGLYWYWFEFSSPRGRLCGRTFTMCYTQ